MFRLQSLRRDIVSDPHHFRAGGFRKIEAGFKDYFACIASYEKLLLTENWVKKYHRHTMEMYQVNNIFHSLCKIRSPTNTQKKRLRTLCSFGWYISTWEDGLVLAAGVNENRQKQVRRYLPVCLSEHGYIHRLPQNG